VGRAMRIVWLAVSIAVLAIAGSGAPGMAAIAPPSPTDGVASIQPLTRGGRCGPPGDRHVHHPGDQPGGS